MWCWFELFIGCWLDFVCVACFSGVITIKQAISAKNKSKEKKKLRERDNLGDLFFFFFFSAFDGKNDEVSVYAC